ncbi:MAG: hypothetical protein WD157_00540 [Patescibacteria group bacterium]
MSTIKPRINITTDEDVRLALKGAAKRDGVPVATKAAELILIGLTLEEDIILASIADRRTARGAKFIDHVDAWK